MRIAMCMYGIVGGTKGADGAGKPIDLRCCYDLLKKHVLNKNDPIDFFIHTWSWKQSKNLEDIYAPVIMNAESQEYFEKNNVKLEGAAFRVKSRWVSSQRSLKLKRGYEESNGFKYDCVMLNRFDVEFLSDLRFENYDMTKFWASKDLKFAEPGEGRHQGFFLQDMWFFSNSENMDYLADLGDTVDSDNGHRAAYNHIIKKFKISDAKLYPSIDYDLYRWRHKTSNDIPNKWYRHPDPHKIESE